MKVVGVKERKKVAKGRRPWISRDAFRERKDSFEGRREFFGKVEEKQDRMDGMDSIHDLDHKSNGNSTGTFLHLSSLSPLPLSLALSFPALHPVHFLPKKNFISMDSLPLSLPSVNEWPQQKLKTEKGDLRTEERREGNSIHLNRATATVLWQREDNDFFLPPTTPDSRNQKKECEDQLARMEILESKEAKEKRFFGNWKMTRELFKKWELNLTESYWIFAK